MAFIEQMICGLAGGSAPTTAILARSPGLTREVAAEIMTVCSGWRPPLGHVADQQALLSAPLHSSSPGDPSALYLAARAVMDGTGRIQCHALVLAEPDYAAYGFSPYRLEREELYLAGWSPGLILERIERRPSALSPVVTPLPGARDADLIDEALRLYFASGRLVLPLAGPEEEADRFLALFLESLPLYARRGLTFASFAPGGQDSRTVGAVCMSDGSFNSWRRSLMSAVRKPLPAEIENYVAAVRRHLTAGDFMALDVTSRTFDRAPATARRSASTEPRLEVLSATVTRAAEPAPEANERWRPPREDPVPVGAMAATLRREAGAGRPVAPRPGAGRAARPPERRPWLAILALAALVAALLMTLPRRQAREADAGPREPWPAAAVDGDVAERIPGGVPPATPSAPRAAAATGAPSDLSGVIDIGALYDTELEAFRRETSAPGAEARWLQAGEEARAALRERGGDNLRRQAHAYCEAAGQDIPRPGRPDREAERTGRLAREGATISGELRRLVLASYAFGRGEPWSDLGRLDGARMAARWDSVQRRDPDRLAAAMGALEVTGLAERVTHARRVLGARAEVARLLAVPRRDKAWVGALAAAAAALDEDPLPPTAAAWRAGALGLVRLKQAEDATGLGGMALAPGYESDAWLPPVVREAQQALRTDVALAGEALAPPLARATIELYAGLGRARELIAAGSSPNELGQLFAVLSANAALAFDPVVYAGHVDRTRMLALSALMANGRAPDAIPVGLFPDEDRHAAQAFFHLEQAGADAAAWREFAAQTSVPFLARWASLRAAMPDQPRPPSADPFEADFQRLTVAAAELAAMAQRGQDWTGRFLSLRETISGFAARHPVQPSTPTERREKLARVAVLAAALERPLPLRIESVTVRLAPELLTGPAEIGVELVAGAGEVVCRTPAILMERDPGGGWRGTRALGAELAVRPGGPLRAVVSRIADGHTVFTVLYIDSPDAAAPGALARFQTGEAPDGSGTGAPGGPGAVRFDLAGWFWRRLGVPDLRQPAAAMAGTGAAGAGP